MRETLSAVQAQLDPAAFLRISRSIVVNVRAIETVERHAERPVYVQTRHRSHTPIQSPLPARTLGRARASGIDVRGHRWKR